MPCAAQELFYRKEKMKKMPLVLIFALLAATAFAETITLKSGKTIEGKILERSDTYIKVSFGDVPLTYFLDEVDSIDGVKLEPVKKEPVQPAAAPAAALNKDALIAKIKEAQKGIGRMDYKQTMELQMQGIMNSKVERRYQIDLPAQVMASVSQVQEIKFDMQPMLRAQLSKQIEEAKAKGMPADKIKEAQANIDKISAQMQEAMNTMARNMQGVEVRNYLTSDTSYTNLKDKWLKMPFAGGQDFWQAFAKIRAGTATSDDINAAMSAVSASYKEMLRSLLQQFSSSGKSIYDYYDYTDNISDGTFEGAPCYILDIRSQEMVEMFRRAAMEQIRAMPQSGIELKISSFAYKEFIAKSDYRKLGSQVDFVLTMSNPNKPGEVINGYMKEASAYAYPQNAIVLPEQLQQARAVKDEEELKKIVMEELGQQFKPGQ
jgi:hypothetical protein